MGFGFCNKRRSLAMLVASLGSLLAGSYPAALAQARVKHAVTIGDLETLRQAIYMRLSPDGKTLAYVMQDGNLWLLSTRPSSSPRRLFKGTVPLWSPDGRRLAYYSAFSGTLQLWVFDMTNSRVEQVTHIPGGIDPDPSTRFSGWSYDMLRYDWSPDGQKLVFCSRVVVEAQNIKHLGARTGRKSGDTARDKPLVLTDSTPPEWTLEGVFRSGGFVPHQVNDEGSVASNTNGGTTFVPQRTNQLFIVDLRTKSEWQLTKDTASYFNPNWSPDGKKIVCASGEGNSSLGGGNGTTNIYAINATTGAKTALTTGPGVKRLPLWSPDGEKIAFSNGQLFGMVSVFVVLGESGEVLNVTSRLARSVTEFSWYPDSESLAVTYQDGVSWPIARVQIQQGDFQVLGGGAAAFRWCMTVSRSGAVAWQLSDGTSEGVIKYLPAKTMSPYVATNLNKQIELWELGKQEIVRWKNAHGDDLEGILIKPVGFREGHKYPLIVDCYPDTINAFMGDPMNGNQAFASEGYAVFYPDARAPNVWIDPFKTEDYDRAAKGAKGWEVTYDDVMSGVDRLIYQGIADPTRLGLLGFSNGAAIVNQLIMRTSKFKCAVSVAGALSVDWLTPFFLMTSNPIIPTMVGATPWEDSHAYLELSAIYGMTTGSFSSPTLRCTMVYAISARR
jgi:dipeptidyl aminopeptidase/acylaminoacyl peptidase